MNSLATRKSERWQSTRGFAVMFEPFDLPNWKTGAIRSCRPQHGGLLVEASYIIVPERCPKCRGAGWLLKHGRKIIDFTDVPSGGKTITIRVDRPRYLCRSCKSTSFQPLPDMDERHRLTTRCIQFVLIGAVRRPFTSVAREIGVDEKTIRNIVAEGLPNFLRRARTGSARETDRFLFVREAN